MLVLGLTGSVGMGKSTAAGFFVEAGVPVHDADAAVHRLYAGEAVPLIEAAFPGTTRAVAVDRALLAQAVLADAGALTRLERIVHPLVSKARDAFLSAAVARLERVVRSLAQQGVDPRAVNVDWVTLRNRQAERAKDDVKAELIVDKIASTENIDVTEEEITHELEHAAGHSNESVDALRARLTKQGALDRMKAKLRSDKTLDWLAQNAKIQTAAAAAGK